MKKILLLVSMFFGTLSLSAQSESNNGADNSLLTVNFNDGTSIKYALSPDLRVIPSKDVVVRSSSDEQTYEYDAIKSVTFTKEVISSLGNLQGNAPVVAVSHNTVYGFNFNGQVSISSANGTVVFKSNDSSFTTQLVPGIYVVSSSNYSQKIILTK